jgi:hypothetical protein
VEFGINSTFGNPDYTPTAHSIDEIRSVLDTFNIQVNGMDRYELPYLYRILKLHKSPYKHRCISGPSKCLTKPLSLLLTKILTAVKEKLQTYCATTNARNIVNQMWILKNSKELLANLKAQNLSQNSTQTYDFSTLCTTIPYEKLKSRFFYVIDNCFVNIGKGNIHI